MASARYHRGQAELCLEMARQISDRLAADALRAEAARHFDRATGLEKAVPSSSQLDLPAT
jgi:hypothetical protein